MKLIKNTYQHKEDSFKIIVTTCNRKIVTTENLESGDIVKFNRGKFEFMINKGVFSIVEAQNIPVPEKAEPAPGSVYSIYYTDHDTDEESHAGTITLCDDCVETYTVEHTNHRQICRLSYLERSSLPCTYPHRKPAPVKK